MTVWITTNCGKFFRRWEHQTTWPASWEIWMQVKKQVRTGHGATHWFQIGKGLLKAVYCHPAYLTYMYSTSYKMLGWMTHKVESRYPGETSTSLPMNIQDWFYLLAIQGTLKSLLQHHSSKASVPRCSVFFIVQLLHPYNEELTHWKRLWCWERLGEG